MCAVPAATRIAPFVHRTPVMTSASLDEWVGATGVLKCEHLQRGGAVQVPRREPTWCSHSTARWLNAAWPPTRRGITQLHWRSQRRRVVFPAYIVMPDTAPAVKKDAVALLGATITFCENTPEAREGTLADVVARTGATEIHPFDNDRVIAGAGTAVLELLEAVPDLDVVMAPVGGGGLLSGTSIVMHGVRPDVRLDRRGTRGG